MQDVYTDSLFSCPSVDDSLDMMSICFTDWKEEYYPEAIKSVQEAICSEFERADQLLNRGNRRTIALNLYFRLI